MEVMQRHEKRYLSVDDHTVEFYFWGDETTPVIKVSVVNLVKGLFRNKYKHLYSESHMRYKIHSFNETARNVVRNYKKELSKWN